MRLRPPGHRRPRSLRVPQFRESDDLWRGLGRLAGQVSRDPWGRALGRVGRAPGCSPVPVPPDRRVELEWEILLGFSGVDDDMHPDLLRAAARFGHPLYAVFRDLAERQGWRCKFARELANLDRVHAPFRDPPGGLPELPPMAGPYRVVCSDDGFWDGNGWTPRLADAVKVPRYARGKDKAFRAALARAGGAAVEALVPAHPVRQPADGQPTGRGRRTGA